MILSYIIMAVLILVDVILKQIFSNIYAAGSIVSVIDNTLYVGYVQNTGASFGLLQGQQFLFFIITLFALVLFGYFFSKSDWKTKKSIRLPLYY
nr:signal peptidase II [Acholeplasma laidlawii]